VNGAVRGHDDIVVGSGSAGGIVAARLAERGRRVLLLEAGPDFAESAIPEILTTDVRVPVHEYDWGYRSEGDREIDLPRGRCVGGSSATNAVAAIRPQPADLDAWGVPEWSWEACLPALCRFETDAEYGHEPYHGADGPIHVERIDIGAAAPVTRAVFEALLSAGHAEALDQNAPGATGAGAQPSNTRDGARQSTLVTYIARARTLATFSLRADALVDRVLLRDGRATGVVLAGGEVLGADRVILSAGVFATPLILMRSGIGPAEQLRAFGVDVVADLPVGDGLHDHPAIGLLALAKQPGAMDRRLFARVMARASFDGRIGEEDIHLFGPFTAEGVRSPIPADGFVVAGMVAKPLSRGHVRLRSTDPADAPRVVLNFCERSEDLEMFVHLMLEIERTFDQPALKEVTEQFRWRPSQEEPANLRAAARAAALTDHHEAGTCSIGPVLAPDLAVHGIDSLYVCDASVMPDTPRCNTNFPTMMVAERFMELLKD